MSLERTSIFIIPVQPGLSCAVFYQWLVGVLGTHVIADRTKDGASPVHYAAGEKTENLKVVSKSGAAVMCFAIQ